MSVPVLHRVELVPSSSHAPSFAHLQLFAPPDEDEDEDEPPEHDTSDPQPLQLLPALPPPVPWQIGQSVPQLFESQMALHDPAHTVYSVMGELCSQCVRCNLAGKLVQNGTGGGMAPPSVTSTIV